MGSGINIRCGNCIKEFSDFNFIEEYENKSKNVPFFQSFRMGIGMCPPTDYFYDKIFKKPVIYDLVKEKNISNDIKTLIEKKVLVIDGYYAIYYCSKCKHLYNKFYFKLDDNNIYEPKYLCRYCKHLLEKINIDMEDEKVIFKNINNEKINILCKKCGSDNLIMKQTMNWD